MNESNELEKKDMSKANVWIAVILGLVALTVAVLPFLYIKNAVIN